MGKCRSNADLKLTRAQADFIGCLMTALISALPCFIEGVLACLAGGGPSTDDDDYDPGNRTRCD